MKNRYSIINLIAIMILVAMASCKSSENIMPYFVDIDSTAQQVPLRDYTMVIKPSDELFINVNSSSPEATARFNAGVGNPAKRSQMLESSTPQQITYTVDTNGDICFPTLGMIHVAGMTVEQLRDYLTKQISKEVNDPIVHVQLVSFTVNVAGEVTRPGRIWVTSPRYSILDAITQAGDLNQYGRRDNVLLIREEDGHRTHVRINLNSSDILDSPYFYLKQNDYIYVEPNNIRKDNAEYNQFNSYRLSVISTIVSGSASIISLIIALTR